MINYTYNADGVRIGKSGSRAGTFIVSGTQILREINSVATIDYLYDENGSPVGLTYKGKTYYYRKNLQGDIINITDSTGAKVVTYTYNAWGKIMSMTGNMELAVNNPFRYRGYYYDVESGLYYLNSRYYDPQTGRFINADSYVSTGQGITGTNMFAYCANDPVCCNDVYGESAAVAGLVGVGSAASSAGLIIGVGILFIPIPMASFSAINNLNSLANLSASEKTLINLGAKTKAKIKKEKYKYDYWIATKVTVSKSESIFIAGKGISYKTAINYVKHGGDVFASNRSKAYKLALAVGNGKRPVGPERHYNKITGSSLGYWWHYHDGNRKGGHIFYV